MPRVAMLCGMMLIVLAMSSCSEPQGQACETDSDCEPGYRCASSGGVVFGERLCLLATAPAGDAGADTHTLDADSSTDTASEDAPASDADTGVDASDTRDTVDTADTADARDTSDTDTTDINAGPNELLEVTLTSESGEDKTTDDLFLSVTKGGGVAATISDWKIDGQSLTQLYVPLDRITNGEAPVYGGSQASCALGAGSAAPVAAFGLLAGAYDFDGVNDKVACTGDFDFSTPFSVEVWIEPDIAQEGGGNHGIVAAVEEDHSAWSWQLRFGSPNQGRLGWKINDGTPNAWLSINKDLAVGQWYHVVATFNGTTTRLYLDGMLADLADIPLRDDAVGTVLVGEDGWTNHFDGLIDGVRIYRRALSASQIRALYGQGSADANEPNDGHVLTSDETASGNTVQACVTPHNGQNDGPEACSNTLTVGQ